MPVINVCLKMLNVTIKQGKCFRKQLIFINYNNLKIIKSPKILFRIIHNRNHMRWHLRKGFFRTTSPVWLQMSCVT